MSTTDPTVKGNFASANGDFYAEASNSNRHRRATPAELKAHFKESGSGKDKPAHWYEAQLIHYGLQPSKTKAVAFKRLFDAVNGGKLSVPSHIMTVEAELKKEWTRRDREAKKAAKRDVTSFKNTPPSTTTTGQKRKAKEAIDLTVDFAGINATVSATNKSAAQGAGKKAKTKSVKATNATLTEKPPKVKSVPKVNAESDKDLIPPRRQLARCSRGGSFAARGGRAQRPPQGRVFDEPPPAYSEYDNTSYFSFSSPRDTGSSSYDSSNRNSEAARSLPKLGLLNGRYEIDATDIINEWPHLDSDFELVLTLNGDELWGKFDLGIYVGILRIDVRPWESSPTPVDFTWRGREHEGEIIYGNDNMGWIKFLGGGRVEGWLDRMEVRFSGQRAPNQGTRSEIAARSMIEEWRGYSEEDYERENRARWGGSSWW